MKKVWLGICCSLFLLCGNQKALAEESRGFETPEAAAGFLAEALAEQDYERAMEAFPIEEVIENADFTVYMEESRGSMWSRDGVLYLPQNSEANRELNRSAMECAVKENITAFARNLLLPGKYKMNLAEYRMEAIYDSMENILEDLEEVHAENLSGLTLLAMDLLEDGTMGSYYEYLLEWAKAASGADSAQLYMTAFQKDYQNYLAQIQVVQYGDRYYLWDIDTVTAEQDEEGEVSSWSDKFDWCWTESGDYQILENGDGTVTITEYHGTEEALEIPELLEGKKVTAIGKKAFGGCENLKSVSLPASLQRIGANAFGECINLTEVSISEGVKWIDEAAFSACQLTEARLPASLEEIGQIAFMGTSTFSVAKGSQAFQVIDGSLFSKDKTALFYYRPEVEAASYTVPKGVKKIGAGAFLYQTALEEVILPETLEEIESMAFAGCGFLESIQIPDSVRRIGKGAFMDCEGLKTVQLPASMQIIEEATFAYCYNLKEIVIPDQVEKIGTAAFFYCYCLSDLRIPSTVRKIADDSFVKTGRLVVEEDSYAAIWAEKNGIAYSYDETGEAS